MNAAPKPRPKYYDLNLAHLPAPGLLSIFHRVSGALLYMLHASLGSEEGYARLADFFAHPVVKLALLGVVWLYAHHFFAGIRYLLLDMHIGIDKAPARASAIAVFAFGLAATLLI